jgi:hypothetical protein
LIVFLRFFLTAGGTLSDNDKTSGEGENDAGDDRSDDNNNWVALDEQEEENTATDILTLDEFDTTYTQAQIKAIHQNMEGFDCWIDSSLNKEYKRHKTEKEIVDLGSHCDES